MSSILITGSTEGLGRLTAQSLLQAGHEVIVHARTRARLETVRDLTERGAVSVVGDLADPVQVREVADQANATGRLDSVIHNAGIYRGPQVIPVNIVAPYLLTALLNRPRRLVYLSSSEHLSGRPRLDGVDWRSGGSYPDSKLFVTALAFAVARRWPGVSSHAVDPGWVPTRMGGPGAPDDLTLGHLTQEWLATSDDEQARASGGYWHHQKHSQPHPAARDQGFQDALLDALARHTGVALPADGADWADAADGRTAAAPSRPHSADAGRGGQDG